MPCNLLTNNIACNSSAVRGVFPTVEIYPYQKGAIVKNSGGEVIGIAGQSFTITASKFAFNCGADLVVSDVKENTYSHYFSGLLSIVGNAEIDKLDGIIVVAIDNTGKKLVYGAENGLWKSSQTKRANDANGMLTVEFTTREGQEETYSELVAVDNYGEAINTLSIGSGSVTPQKVNLAVDSDKTCYVILPNGTLLTSTAGVIDYNWTGAAGDVVLVVPKDTRLLRSSNNDLSAETLTINGAYKQINLNDDPVLSSSDVIKNIVAYNAGSEYFRAYLRGIESAYLPKAVSLNLGDNPLVSIYCPKAYTIGLNSCALPISNVKSILDDAYTLYLAGQLTGTINLGGGTNAELNPSVDFSTIHGIAYGILIDNMTAGGWTITLNIAAP